MGTGIGLARQLRAVGVAWFSGVVLRKRAARIRWFFRDLDLEMLLCDVLNRSRRAESKTYFFVVCSI